VKNIFIIQEQEYSKEVPEIFKRIFNSNFFITSKKKIICLILLAGKSITTQEMMINSVHWLEMS